MVLQIFAMCQALAEGPPTSAAASAPAKPAAVRSPAAWNAPPIALPKVGPTDADVQRLVLITGRERKLLGSCSCWLGNVLQITPDMPQPENSQFSAEAVAAAGHRCEALTRAR